MTPQKAASIVSGLVDQMARVPQLGFGSPLSAPRSATTTGSGTGSGTGRGGHGGSGGGSGRGGARRGGGSVRAVARGLAGFLSDVEKKGFREALVERGFSDISGKTPDEIALALADILGGPSSLIEETALRDALMALMLEWSEGAMEIEGLAESVTTAAKNIESTLHDFFGHYIFEIFKTVGYQGVLAKHGFDKAQNMANQIREFIDAKVGSIESSRPLSSIDWNGAAGAEIIDGIVADTIEIFGEVEQ